MDRAINVKRAKEFLNSLSKEPHTGRTKDSYVKFWELDLILSMLEDSECCKCEIYQMNQIMFVHAPGCNGNSLADINHIWCEQCKRTQSLNMLRQRAEESDTKKG